jgi:hypothetical protein
MGEFLTMRGNKAFSFAGDFADENFAREVMKIPMFTRATEAPHA